MRRVLPATLMAMVVPVIAFAHGGGLNAEGCHNNRKTGDYHCHRGPRAERKAPNPTQLHGGGGSAEQRLEQLERLRDRKMITDEEFRQKHRAILDDL